MFRTVFPPIIRSSKLHIKLQVFVKQYRYLPLAWPGQQQVAVTVWQMPDAVYMQFWAPDDGRKTRLKHVYRLTEINKLRIIGSCWLYSANILAMHGPMNVKCKCYLPVLTSSVSCNQRYFIDACFDSRLLLNFLDAVKSNLIWFLLNVSSPGTRIVPSANVRLIYPVNIAPLCSFQLSPGTGSFEKSFKPLPSNVENMVSSE